MTTQRLGKYQELFAGNLLTECVSFDESNELLSALVPMFEESESSREAEDRFSIYRNNVTLSLSTAIADTFPVVKRLIGDDCFKSAAIQFVRSHPPEQPSLLFYGEGFIDFLKTYPGCSQLTYLPDVAQLEWSYIKAFHAEKVKPLDLVNLQKLDPEKLGDISFTLKPSVQLIYSEWPIDTIWEENLKQDVAEINLSDYSECYLLVYRNDMQVQIINLTTECFNLLSALKTGKSITNAWQYTLEKQQTENRPEIDENEISRMLGYLFGLNIFSENSNKFD